MGDLYPTKTQLALMRDIACGAVLRFPNGETRCYWDDGTYSQVNARVGDMERAGWTRVGGVVTSGPYQHPTQRPRLIQLTRDGEAVLAAVEALTGEAS